MRLVVVPLLVLVSLGTLSWLTLLGEGALEDMEAWRAIFITLSVIWTWVYLLIQAIIYVEDNNKENK